MRRPALQSIVGILPVRMVAARFARRLKTGTAALVFGALTAGHIPAPDARLVESVQAIGMTVSNMDRSVRFFSQILSFDKVSDIQAAGPDCERLYGISGTRVRVVTMRLGRETIELNEYITPKGRAIPADSRSHDRWFRHIAVVVSDMDRAYRRLRKFNVTHTSTSPQRLPDWNKAAAGIRAFYFKDPDGHNLEVIQFPKGKGDAIWHRPTDRLFLGIDHTAIAVADTGRSLSFYGDLVGLHLRGSSENYGIEQDHLNGLFGSRVRISGLRAVTGPGIELLHYLTPADGRPAPRDTRANDLWHWHTSMRVSSVSAAAEKLNSAKAPWASAGPDLVPRDPSSSNCRGFLVRDHDGHGLKFVGA